MSKSVFENAWRFLKMTDVRVMRNQFDKLGESMNVPEIQQLIDPDPAVNMDTYNYLGDRPLGPLAGKHYAGGYDVMRGRSKGRQVNAPNYLEMNLNQPFSADTLTALRNAGFTAFGRKMPGISDSAMHYRIKGGSDINRPVTDEERMRITSHPAGGGVDVDVLAEIKRRQLAENIANREKGINPNIEYRQQEIQRRREEREKYLQSAEYKEMMAEKERQAEELRERKARQEAEGAERRRIYNLPENVAARAAKQRELEEQRAAAEAEAEAKRAAAEAKRKEEMKAKFAAARKRQEEKEAVKRAEELERKRRADALAGRNKGSNRGPIGPARGKRGGKR